MVVSRLSFATIFILIACGFVLVRFMDVSMYYRTIAWPLFVSVLFCFGTYSVCSIFVACFDSSEHKYEGS